MTLLAYHEAPTKRSCIADRIGIWQREGEGKTRLPGEKPLGARKNQHINGRQMLFTYSDVLACVYKYKAFKYKGSSFTYIPKYNNRHLAINNSIVSWTDLSTLSHFQFGLLYLVFNVWPRQTFFFGRILMNYTMRGCLYNTGMSFVPEWSSY